MAIFLAQTASLPSSSVYLRSQSRKKPYISSNNINEAAILNENGFDMNESVVFKEANFYGEADDGDYMVEELQQQEEDGMGMDYAEYLHNQTENGEGEEEGHDGIPSQDLNNYQQLKMQLAQESLAAVVVSIYCFT